MPIHIDQIYFMPPIAVARLGGSHTPVDAFDWVEDPSAFGAGNTVVRPKVSLQVMPDGSVEPYIPRQLQFKDSGLIRPVCPFFELTAAWTDAAANPEQQSGPLTPSLLEQAGLRLDQMWFSVHAVNRKAARRTGDASCSFEAAVYVRATDYVPQELMAYSREPGREPLVSPERPIRLGSVQVIRPSRSQSPVMQVNLDTIRIRFTPGAGEVYGPPIAKEGESTGSRRGHPIVPERNRILNPRASWTAYTFDNPPLPTPQPRDTYDGADDPVRKNVSFGVVDDTCDALIRVFFNPPGTTGLEARARVIVAPPHFAPDRRPFFSWADDLDDRAAIPPPTDVKAMRTEVLDLFQRALETAALTNVDLTRNARLLPGGMGEKPPAAVADEFPAADGRTMTTEDVVKGEKFLSFLGQQMLGDPAGGDPDTGRPKRSELAVQQHEKLAEPEYLLWFLTENADRLRDIIRPPYARVPELAAAPDQNHGLRELRDPRVAHDLSFDMRMPPYLRDSDGASLSITHRQWEVLDRFMSELKDAKAQAQSPVPPFTRSQEHVDRWKPRRSAKSEREEA